MEEYRTPVDIKTLIHTSSIEIYDKNRLIEYNNKIINENIYYNLLKLIYYIKDKNRINNIFNNPGGAGATGNQNHAWIA
mgnify:CR=1 FL=1